MADRPTFHPDPHTCTICGQHHPVPSLARDCEQRHVNTEAHGNG